MGKGAHTTTQIAVTLDGYFASRLNDGGVRVGLLGECSIDYPPTHPQYAAACALTIETIEQFFDNVVAPAILAR